MFVFYVVENDLDLSLARRRDSELFAALFRLFVRFEKFKPILDVRGADGDFVLLVGRLDRVLRCLSGQIRLAQKIPLGSPPLLSLSTPSFRLPLPLVSTYFSGAAYGASELGCLDRRQLRRFRGVGVQLQEYRSRFFADAWNRLRIERAWRGGFSDLPLSNTAMSSLSLFLSSSLDSSPLSNLSLMERVSVTSIGDSVFTLAPSDSITACWYASFIFSCFPCTITSNNHHDK